MDARIFEAFDTICAELAITGAALEIGASPYHQCLLDLPALCCTSSRTGVGLDGDAEGAHYRILQANAHDLSMFADHSFQLVLCNSMLEHDPRFWLTLQEASRVTAPGGWMVFGVPSYGAMGNVPGLRLLNLLCRLPGIGRGWKTGLAASSVTLGLHHFPSDYYRFSEYAMAEVILDGLEEVSTRMLMSPPRVIGRGRKPLVTAPS